MESARGSVHWGWDDATIVDIKVDPQRRRFGRSESDFALQPLIEACSMGMLCANKESPAWEAPAVQFSQIS